MSMKHVRRDSHQHANIQQVTPAPSSLTNRNQSPLFKVQTSRSPNPASDSQAAKIYNKAGDEHFYCDRFSQAIDCYKKAIKLDPNYADANNNLGWTYNRTKKWDEAIVCYQKAIKLNPKHRSAYFNLQATVQNKGSDEHIRSSVEILDDILKGDPQISLAQLTRTNLSSGVGDRQ